LKVRAAKKAHGEKGPLVGIDAVVVHRDDVRAHELAAERGFALKAQKEIPIRNSRTPMQALYRDAPPVGSKRLVDRTKLPRPEAPLDPIATDDGWGYLAHGRRDYTEHAPSTEASRAVRRWLLGCMASVSPVRGARRYLGGRDEGSPPLTVAPDSNSDTYGSRTAGTTVAVRVRRRIQIE
jgi:hypothetical protein